MTGVDCVPEIESCMDAIEENLKTNKEFSKSNAKMLSCIIESFGKAWKFMQKYPVPLEEKYEKQFNDIFLDMSHIYYEKSSLTYTCDICDTDVRIINNDHQFSYQMHEQTVEHKEAFNCYRIFRPGSPSKYSPHEEKVGTAWISVAGGRGNLCCATCFAKLKTDDDIGPHLRGECHKIISATINPILGLKKHDEISTIISKVEKNGSQYYFCNICKVKIPNSPRQRPFESLLVHANGKKHTEYQIKLNRMYSRINI